MASVIPRTIPFVLGSSVVTVFPPTAPTGFTATARAGGAQLAWTAPAGATDYTLTAAGPSVSRRYTFAAGSPVAISGLANGSAYTLSLVARNSAGSSPAATVTVTPNGTAVLPGSDGTTLVTPAPIAPAAPVLTAVTPFDSSAVATWAASVDDGGSPVTGYTLTVTTVADGTVALTAPAAAGDLSATLAPLTNGTQYAVSIIAGNAIGPSQASAPALVTPVAGPPPPPPPAPPPPPYVPVPEPMVAAFPADRVFRPDYWGLTADEVDAL